VGRISLSAALMGRGVPPPVGIWLSWEVVKGCIFFLAAAARRRSSSVGVPLLAPAAPSPPASPWLPTPCANAAAKGSACGRDSALSHSVAIVSECRPKRSPAPLPTPAPEDRLSPSWSRVGVLVRGLCVGEKREVVGSWCSLRMRSVGVPGLSRVGVGRCRVAVEPWEGI